MNQSNRVSDSEKGMRKFSSALVVTAMVVAGTLAVFAFSATNVVALVDLEVVGLDLALPTGTFPGDNNLTMLSLGLIPQDEAVGVTSMTFSLTAGSTGASADVERIFLFSDIDGDGVMSHQEMAFQPNAGILSSVTNPTFPQAMPLSGYTVGPFNPKYMIALIDIAGSTTEGTLLGIELTSVACDDPAPTITTGASSEVEVKYVIWSDEMESGVNGWTTDGQPSVLWHQTTYISYPRSPTTSWWYADPVTRRYETPGQRNFGNLTSPNIDLSGYSKPTMSFWQYLVNENWPGSDEVRLYIQDTGAGGWDEIEMWSESPTNWTKKTYDLNTYAGKTIKVRVNFDTIDALNNDFHGLNVDRLYVYGSQEAHDVAVQDFSAPNYALPTDNVPVDASIANLGQSAEDNGTAGVDAWLKIDSSYAQNQNIPSISLGGSQPVSFLWNPGTSGDYDVCIEAWPVFGESNTANNEICKTVRVRDQPAKKISVVRSYGTKMSPAIATWQYLNANWELDSLGPTPVDIEWSLLNKTGITYGDIAATGADVLVVSSSMGLALPQPWSELTLGEINAIKQYTLEGHGLVATLSTFNAMIPNNNDLTDMFGIVDQDYNLTTTASSADLDHESIGHALLTNVPDPFTIGNPHTTYPLDDETWDDTDLRPGSTGGTYVARSADNSLALVEFKRLVYISWMPEFFGSADDVQILYNAMVWSQYQTVAHDVSMSNMVGPSRVKPTPTVDFTATVSNLGGAAEDNATGGIDVYLTQDGVIVNSQNIPSLGLGASQDVTLAWDPSIPPLGTYNICMMSWQVSGETDLTNNEVCMNVEIIDQNIIVIAVLDSWGTDFAGSAPWDDLNLNWATYGTYEILIDYATLDKEGITLQDLQWSYADVLLVSSSNSTGSPASEFTPSEITAIQTYVNAGHGIVGTGTVMNTAFLFNNNQLAPLFGLDAAPSYTETSGVTNYDSLDPTHTLFYNMPDPYTATNDVTCTPGITGSPSPTGWDASLLMGAGEYKAESQPTPPRGAVVANDAGTYRGAFLTATHEMSSGTDDKQILYNAMCWAGGCTLFPVTPPPEVQDLWISVVGDQIELDWTVSDPSPDIWYNVFRALTVDSFDYGLLHAQVQAPPYQDDPGTGVDPESYFYVVRAFNTSSGLTETNTNKVGKVYMTLHKGTNDISIPFIQQDTSVATVFAAIAGDVDDVSTYNGTTGLWKSWPGTLTDVDHTMGLRVRANRNNVGFVTVGRVPKQTAIPLTIGADAWFFVGFPNLLPGTSPLPNILDDNGLLGLYVLVMYYDPADRKAPWKWFDPNDPVGSPLQGLDTGRGYWIYMSASGTWTVPGE